MVSRNWTPVLLIAAAVPLVRAFWWQAPAASTSGASYQMAFRIGLGVGDSQPTTWDGKVSLERGRVQKLEGWHFEKSDEVLPGNGWRASTRASVSRPMKLPFTQWRDAFQPPILPNGVTVTAEGPREDEVRVETAQGNFAFSLRDLRLGGKLPFLNGRAEVEGVPAATLVAGETSECDDPSVVVTRSGETWVFWVDHANGADSVLAKRFAKGAWSKPIPISDSHHTDVFKTAAAVDAVGRVWVVWSSQITGNWDLYGSRWDGKRWSRIARITDDPGPDIFHRLASGGGKLYLAWQGFREGRSNILLKVLEGDRWSQEIRASQPGVNSWDPALTADPSGRAYVAWDAYASGNYDIFLRSYADGKLSDLTPVTRSPNFEAHADLACGRDGKVWLAWDESGPNWGKDTGYELQKAGKVDDTSLWDGRKVRVACWENGILKRPRGDLFAAIPRDWETLMELPRLAIDPAERVWLFFRRRTLRFEARKVGVQANAVRVVGRGGRWDIYATAYSGGAWSPLIWVPDSAGRNDVRLSASPAPDGSVWAAWESDQRPYDTFGPQRSAVFVARMDLAGPAAAPPVLEPETPAAPPEGSQGSKEASGIARVKQYQVSVGGKTYHVYRGDLHRHTDISFDGFADGSLLDLYRYAIDCAGLDFVAVTDHGAGGDREYPWWQTQKSADLFFVANTFVPLYGYERSLSYPNGHRNVIYARRGFRTLPSSHEENTGKEGAAKLFAWLKKTQGVSIPHTSGTEMGTDWRDNDPAVEPLVEIFQGLRASYEYPQAPRSDIQDYPNMFLGQLREKGFVSNAWAKGYKLGVEASSDHGSTHVSYSCLYSTALTRDALLDAIRQRHSYAATDNIVLDFRMEDKSTGEHLMGDIVSTKTVPVFVIHIDGTATLKQVDIIKSNRIVYTANPAASSFALRYADNQLEPGEAYYYVRAEQEDGQMAWSSPIWVTYRP